MLSSSKSLRLRGPFMNVVCRWRIAEIRIPNPPKVMQQTSSSWLLFSSSSSSSSCTNNSPLDLKFHTPSLMMMMLSTTRNAHSRPCLVALSEKRTMGVMTPEEVEIRIDRIMRLANDARSCIQDCQEYIATDHFHEELHCARIAVDAAMVAYSELLEELALSAEGVEILNSIRKVYAPGMESLKQELNKISKPKEEGEV